MLGVLLLLTEGLMESGNSTNDANCHEAKRDDRPDDTPALRRTAVLAGEYAGIRRVYFAKDQVIALFKRMVNQGHVEGSIEHSQYPRHYTAQT